MLVGDNPVRAQTCRPQGTTSWTTTTWACIENSEVRIPPNPWSLKLQPCCMSSIACEHCDCMREREHARQPRCHGSHDVVTSAGPGHVAVWARYSRLHPRVLVSPQSHRRALTTDSAARLPATCRQGFRRHWVSGQARASRKATRVTRRVAVRVSAARSARRHAYLARLVVSLSSTTSLSWPTSTT